MNEEELQDEWLRRLQQAAREFELKPAEESWEVIAHGLRSRRRRRWWAMAAAWLLVLGLGGTAWWMLYRTPAGHLQQHVVVQQNPPAAEKAEKSLPGEAETSSREPHLPAAHSRPTGSASYVARPIPPSTSQLHTSANFPSSSDFVPTQDNHTASSSSVLLESLHSNRSMLSAEPLRNVHPELRMPPGWGMARATDTGQRQRPITFRIAFAPGLGYRQLVQQAAALPLPAQSFLRMPANNYIPSSALGHDPAFSYLAGVEIQKHLPQHLLVGSGVQLLAFQYHIQAVNLSGAAYTRNSSAMNLSSGSPAQLSTVYGAYNPNALLAPDQYTTLVNQQVSIELPLFAGYRGRMFRRLYWQVTGGGGLDIAIHQQQYVYVSAYQRYIADNDQLRRWNISALFSGSFILLVGRGQIFMGPDVHYQLLNAYRHQTNLKENLYLVSWKIGVIP